MVFKSLGSNLGYIMELVALLEEKKIHTNENNLDATGLDILINLSKAFLGHQSKSVNSVISSQLLDNLMEANKNIKEAMGSGKERHLCTKNACASLEKAITSLIEN